MHIINGDSMKKKTNGQRCASIYYKDDFELFREGLMNPYYYNFGMKKKDIFDGTRTNCLHR